MSRMSHRAALCLAAAMGATCCLAGCAEDDGAASTPLTGAAARTAQDQSTKARQLLAPQPAGVGEAPRRVGPVAVVVPRAFREDRAGPPSPRTGWTYHRLTDPGQGERTALGVVVAPTSDTDAEQAAQTLARTGGSRDAGQAAGLVTTTTWQGVPAYLVHVNTSAGLHVEALTVERGGRTITVVAQAPTSSYPQTGLRRALRSADLTP